MFPPSLKLKFPHYVNPTSHYKLEKIQKDVERMWVKAVESEFCLNLLVSQFEKGKQNIIEESSFPKPKYTGNKTYDMTEVVKHLQETLTEQILVAQGWIAFDWLRGVFIASLVSKISSIYPIFWLSSELASAIELTEPPDVNYRQIKWFANRGVIVLPKRFFISRSGEEIKAIAFTSPVGEEDQELFVSCITDDDIIRGIGTDLQENKPRYKGIIEDVANFICGANRIGRCAIDPSDLVKSSAIDTFLTSRSDSVKATNILIALHLICAQYSDYVDAEASASKKLGFGKNSSINLKLPRWIGKNFSIEDQEIINKNFEQKSLRYGYWKLQNYGSNNNQEKKVIWIKPKLTFNQEESKKRSSSFRTLVLRRYGSKCALCNCSIEELIDAAHIIPFASEGSDHPENGLPLCNSHHTAFDRKLFLIHPLTTEVVPNHTYSLDQLQIQYINLSHLPNLPRKDFLNWRWNTDKSFG